MWLSEREKWQVACLVAILFLCVIVCEVHPELLGGLRGLWNWVGDFACEGSVASFRAIQLSDQPISVQPGVGFYFSCGALARPPSHWQPHWLMFLSQLLFKLTFWCPEMRHFAALGKYYRLHKQQVPSYFSGMHYYVRFVLSSLSLISWISF